MKNAFYIIIGNLVYSLAQWLILLFLIKKGDANTVGLFGLAISIVSPIMIFCNFQIRSVQATDIEESYPFFMYHFTRIISFVFGLFLIGLIIVAFYKQHNMMFIYLIALMKMIDSLSEVAYGRFQQYKIPKYIGYSKLLKGSILIILIFLAYIFELSILNLFILTTIFYLLIYIFYDLLIVKLKTKEYLFGIWKKEKIIQIFKISLPLMLSTFLGSVNTNIPRYIVEKFWGLEILGYFVGFAYLINVGNIFVSSIAQVYLTPLSKLFISGEINKFKNKIFQFMKLTIIISAFGFLIIFLLKNLIIKILFNDSYMIYSTEFLIIILAGIISYIGAFIGYANIASRNFKSILIISSTWVIFTLVTGLLIIPKYGLIGSAWSLVFANCFILLTRIIALKRTIRMKEFELKNA